MGGRDGGGEKNYLAIARRIARISSPIKAAADQAKGLSHAGGVTPGLGPGEGPGGGLISHSGMSVYDALTPTACS